MADLDGNTGMMNPIFRIAGQNTGMGNNGQQDNINPNSMGMGMNQMGMNNMNQMGMNNQMDMNNMNQMGMNNMNNMGMNNMDMNQMMMNQMMMNQMGQSGMNPNMMMMMNMMNNNMNNMNNQSQSQMMNLMNQMNQNNQNNNDNQSSSNQNQSGGISVIFRASGGNQGQKGAPIMVQCLPNEKVADIIEKYRVKSQDRDDSKKFIFNAKNLSPALTVSEAGITNNANIFVVATKGIKGAK